MTKAADRAASFEAVLKRAERAEGKPLPDETNPVAVLVFSFLLWEATEAQALRAFKAVQQHVVDFNELRVALPTEIVAMIGERYPQAMERAQRLHAVLNDVYRREHVVSLDRLVTGGKREAKKYIESLEGITPYVAARSLLISFETHGIPVDDRLRAALIAEGVADESTDLTELSNWLSRQVKAGEGPGVHRALQAWVDGLSGGSRRRSSKSSGRKTKKKTGTRSVRAPRKKKTKSKTKTKTASRSTKR